MAQADKLSDRADSEEASEVQSSENDGRPKKKENARVRFVNEEEIKGRFKDVDEVDHAVPKVKKVHILKNRSSSEQSFLLRSNSFKERVLGYRHGSLEHLNNRSDSLNNNNPKNKNFNEKGEAPGKVHEKRPEEKGDPANGTFKKNANVYSVFQAKTLSERRKSLPTLPTIAAKANERYHRSFSDPKDDALLPIKELRAKALRRLSRGIGRLLRRSSSINISEPDSVYKVAYLGNVLTGWAKGEGCVDKPLATLWRNYNQSLKPDVIMKLSITNSGLKGFTKEHGLTEYWSHRITYCASPLNYPKIFCWVYRHEGRKLKHEMRCHAVLCAKESVSQKITEELQIKLQQALSEFKRDKLSRQNARLSLANAVYDNPSMPRRKILLSVGGNNYRPPLERSKSAPKLMAIEELCSEEDEEEEQSRENGKLCHTWTKSTSPNRKTYNIDDLYPSYTLGRRRSDRIRSPRKISLPAKVCEPETVPLDKCSSLEDSQLTLCGDFNDRRCGDVVRNEETMSFSDEVLSLLVQESNHMTMTSQNECNIDSDSPVKIDEVLDTQTEYSSDDPRTNEVIDTAKENTDKAVVGLLEHLCSQSNFLLLDSDEGSISSGCETASTVTSSDIDMSSIPCQFTPNECNKKPMIEHGDANIEATKVSVLQRVQSFEQLFSKDSLATTKLPRRYSSLKYVSRSVNLEPNESKDDLPTMPIDNTADLCDDDVNLVPIGEKVAYHDRSFKRRSTYPPIKLLSEMTESRIQKSESADIGPFSDQSGHGDDCDHSACDNDSACSDESGYSELLESSYLRDGLVGNTVMV